MDPRPYNFQYRRPRPYNPTFQSPHLYESIYQLKHVPLPAPITSINPQANNPSFFSHNRASSIELSMPKSLEQGDRSARYEPKKQPSQLDKRSSQKSSRVANYGINLIRNSSMDQTEVYKRQSKKFDIISCYPKEYEPNLKKFPRLTLEDRLIEFQGKIATPN